MKTITFDEAVSRSRFTEHGRKLLDIVRKNPGIQLETLVREHDPGPLPFLCEFHLPAAMEGSALRNFPVGGHAVRQLFEAGCIVITELLKVYLPEDVPERTPDEPTEAGAGTASLMSPDDPKSARGAVRDRSR